MLILDTHILIFAISGGLRPAEDSILSGGRWSISAIVLWDLAKLVQLGRVALDFDDREVKQALAPLHVWPIDLDVAKTSTCLDFRGDPADELIAATSTFHGIPLVTRDHIIRGSKLVPLAIPA